MNEKVKLPNLEFDEKFYTRFLSVNNDDKIITNNKGKRKLKVEDFIPSFLFRDKSFTNLNSSKRGFNSSKNNFNSSKRSTTSNNFKKINASSNVNKFGFTFYQNKSIQNTISSSNKLNYNNFYKNKIIQKVKSSNQNINTNHSNHNPSNFTTNSYIVHNLRKINLTKIKEYTSKNKIKFYLGQQTQCKSKQNLEILRKEFYHQILNKRNNKNFNINHQVVENFEYVPQHVSIDLEKTHIETEEEIITKLKQELEESKRQLNEKYNMQHDPDFASTIRIEINPKYEEQKLEILSQKIPQMIQSINRETNAYGDKLDKKDFIKNKYRMFLQNFE